MFICRELQINELLRAGGNEAETTVVTSNTTMTDGETGFEEEEIEIDDEGNDEMYN